MGRWRLRHDFGASAAVQSDMLIVSRGDHPSSCRSCRAGTNAIKAQDSSILVCGGLWREAAGMRAVMAHLCAVWIPAQRAPRDTVEAVSELLTVTWLELADAPGTVGKRSTRALR